MTAATAPTKHQRMRPGGVEPKPDDPPVVGIYQLQETLLEGSDVSFEIRRVGGIVTEAVTVNYAYTSEGGSADFSGATSGTITLPANQNTINVNAHTVARSGLQGDRNVRCTISNASSGSILPSATFANTVLRDADILPIIQAVSLSDTSIEGETIQFSVARVGGSDSIACSVHYEVTSTGGAADFSGATSGTVNIAADVLPLAAIVNVATVNRAGTQGDRTVTFTLSAPVNCTLNTTSVTMILKDYVEPTIPEMSAYKQAAEYREGDTLQVEVRRSGATTAAISATYTWTSSGTIGSDLASPFTGTVNIPIGATKAMVSKAALDQPNVQGDRAITFTLSAPVGCTLSPTHSVQNITLKDYTGVPIGLPKYQPNVPVSKWHCVGFTPPASEGTPKAVYPGGRTGFAQAIAATTWVAGDVIVLDDLTYTGADMVITRSGALNTPNDGSKHLMIRARNHLKAIINFQIKVTGAYVWITGCKLPYTEPWSTGSAGANYNPNASVMWTNRGLWITNCWCTSRSLALFLGNQLAATVDNIKICYNTMDINFPANEYHGTFLGGFDIPTSRNAPGNSDFAYNICRNLTKPAGSGDGASRSFFQIQNSKPNSQAVSANQSCRVHHNWVKGYFKNLFYSKRNIYCGYNYWEPLLNATNVYITQRHGIIVGTVGYDIGGVTEGNRINSQFENIWMEINGAGNTIRGNEVSGGKSYGIYLQNGSIPTGGDTIGVYDAADYASVIENKGFDKVVVGMFNQENVMDNSRGGLVNNVRIYKGTSNWNPTITRDTDPLGNQAPVTAYSLNNGYGPYSAIDAITSEELLAVCGCDPSA